jgi:adenylylsulfate kinase-like enzyme
MHTLIHIWCSLDLKVFYESRFVQKLSRQNPKQSRIREQSIHIIDVYVEQTLKVCHGRTISDVHKLGLIFHVIGIDVARNEPTLDHLKNERPPFRPKCLI